MILDPDALIIKPPKVGETVRSKIEGQLKRRGLSPTPNKINELVEGMGRNENYHPRNTLPLSKTISDGDSARCVVVPETDDLSSLTLMASYLPPRKRLQLSVSFNKEFEFLRATLHEAWHCADTEYLPAFLAYRQKIDADKPEAYLFVDQEKIVSLAYLAYKAEFFAETAAVLTMAARGDQPNIEAQADFRAVSVQMEIDSELKTTTHGNLDKFNPAIYYLTPGLDAAKRFVDDASASRDIRAMTAAEIAATTRQILQTDGMTNAEFSQLCRFVLNPGQNKPPPGYLERLQAARGRIFKIAPAPNRVVAVEDSNKGEAVEDQSAQQFLDHADPAVKEKVLADFEAHLDALDRADNTGWAVAGMIDDLRAKLQDAPNRDEAEKIENELVILRAAASSGLLKEMIRKRCPNLKCGLAADAD